MSESDVLVPPALAGDARSRAFVALVVERFGALDMPALLVNRLDSTPPVALAALGWQYGLIGTEGWGLAESDASRRDLIRRAVQLHRRKGTPWAVRAALQALGFPSVRFDEGRDRLLLDGAAALGGQSSLDGDTRWALFGVTVDVGEERGLTSADRISVVSAVLAWKNARSHLDRVAFAATLTERVEAGETLSVRGRAPADDPVSWGRGAVVLLDGRTLLNRAAVFTWDGSLSLDGTATLNGQRGGVQTLDGTRETVDLRARARSSEEVSAVVYLDGLARCDGSIRCGANVGCYEVLDARTVRRTRLDGRWALDGARVGAWRLDGRRTLDGLLALSAPLRLWGTRREHLALH